MNTRPYRLAVVASRPQPYHSPFFRALAAHPRVDLTVYYLSDIGLGKSTDEDFGRFRSDYPLLEGYRSRFLPNHAPWPKRAHFTGSFHPELFSCLHRRHHNGAILQGWFGLSMWLAHLICWWRGLPVIFRSDVNVADPSRPGPRWIKRIALTRLFRRCRAILTTGSRNAQFYREHGVPEEKLFLTPYAVDNDFFQRQRVALLPQRAEIRRQLGLSAATVAILYSGRLAPEKRVGDLLRAVHRLADPRAWVLLAGEGRERSRLEQLASSLGLAQVRFLGFQTQRELARLYLAADIFVLPSEREPWGLVLNEAMNFALPVVASEVVGAAPDLVKAGENGLLFPAGDTEALAGCLRSLVTDPALRAGMGKQSLERIGNWSHRNSVETVVRLLELAVGDDAGV